MGRYEEMFSRLRAEGASAFVPFAVVGDPNLDESLGVVRALIEGGADALELGIPFSDPIADGPAIQAAALRALEAGVTPRACFELIGRVRSEHPKLPIGLLVYANLVVSGGEAAFYAAAAAAGVDSVLVADVPAFEAEPFVRQASASGVCPVFIAPPNADEALVRKIARITRGYTYVVARPGVTGADDDRQRFKADLFALLEKHGAPPGLLGFGISTPDHVRAALRAGAAGAISGSAVVRIVERNLAAGRIASLGLADFVRQMKAATLP